MLPSFLITFREVIEAALIVATILGILTKLGQKKGVKTVWFATISAAVFSILLLVGSSVLGFKFQEMYSGDTEKIIEGSLMIISTIFITWAVFFLHNYFGKYKTHLLSKLKATVQREEQRGLFILAFTAVFREGIEIVLFLSTIYFSSNPAAIISGFALGVTTGLLVCAGLFAATIRMPIYYAFRATSALLILFAAGLLAHGAHEFTEAGVLAMTQNVYLPFLPEKSTFLGSTIQSMFGITSTMELFSLSLYVTYAAIMAWWVFFRKNNTKTFADASLPEEL